MYLNSSLGALYTTDRILKYYAINAYNDVSYHLTVKSISGYKPVAITGFSTGIANIFPVSVRLSGNVIEVYFKNIHSAPLDGTASFDVLYLKDL